MLVASAAALAVVFSAFTPEKVGPPYKYRNAQNQLVNVPSTIDVPTECPAGFDADCQITIGGELETIYHSDGTVYRRDL